jgi:hypothetical protein
MEAMEVTEAVATDLATGAMVAMAGIVVVQVPVEVEVALERVEPTGAVEAALVEGDRMVVVVEMEMEEGDAHHLLFPRKYAI